MAAVPSYDELKIGAAAPRFRLRGVDDKNYSLADFNPPAGGSEGLLVIFICNHCPYVLAKIEAINKLYEKFKDRVAFVGINSNDPEYPGEGMDNMKKFAMGQGIRFPYLLDATQAIARAYGATCTPDPFLFDRNHQLVFHGRINDAMEPDEPVKEHTMDKNIEKMLAGDIIERSFEPSVGCSIKWLEK